MKKLISIFLIGFVFTVSQHLKAQTTVEKGKTILIEIPTQKNESFASKLDITNQSNSKPCNILVKRGNEKINVVVESKSNKGNYEFEGRELGQETISWEGKNKFRGLKTIGPCNAKGQLTVETIEGDGISEPKLAAQKKAKEEARAREETKLAAQKKAKEEARVREETKLAALKKEEEAKLAALKKEEEAERERSEAKLAAQKREKKLNEVKAEMDKQAAYLKELEAKLKIAELEAKLKIAELEATKTPEQTKEEARIAAEAKALAEAKIAIQMKEEQKKKALEEVRASRKMKVEKRKKALEAVRISKETRKQNKEREQREAKLAAQKKEEEAKLAAQRKVDEAEREQREAKLAAQRKVDEAERERREAKLAAQRKVDEAERELREAKRQKESREQKSRPRVKKTTEYFYKHEGTDDGEAYCYAADLLNIKKNNLPRNNNFRRASKVYAPVLDKLLYAERSCTAETGAKTLGEIKPCLHKKLQGVPNKNIGIEFMSNWNGLEIQLRQGTMKKSDLGLIAFGCAKF